MIVGAKRVEFAVGQSELEKCPNHSPPLWEQTHSCHFLDFVLLERLADLDKVKAD
jgi:hypothetical protein